MIIIIPQHKNYIKIINVPHQTCTLIWRGNFIGLIALRFFIFVVEIIVQTERTLCIKIYKANIKKIGWNYNSSLF